jgi:hypothetical protein
MHKKKGKILDAYTKKKADVVASAGAGLVSVCTYIIYYMYILHIAHIYILGIKYMCMVRKKTLDVYKKKKLMLMLRAGTGPVTCAYVYILYIAYDLYIYIFITEIIYNIYI